MQTCFRQMKCDFLFEYHINSENILNNLLSLEYDFLVNFMEILFSVLYFQDSTSIIYKICKTDAF